MVLDVSKWTYGGAHYKHITLQHPMSNAVSSEVRDKLEVGPALEEVMPIQST